MPSPPAGAAEAARAHLRTRYVARDDAAHLATLASDAYVVLGDRAVPRDEATDAEILAAWADASAREGARPHLVPGDAALWTPDDDYLSSSVPAGHRGLLDLRALDAKTEQDLDIRLGLVSEAGDWRVAFAYLPGPRDPAGRFEAGRLAALSELAGLRAMVAGGPLLSLLEAAWARQAWLPRQRLLALPETAFSCAGTGDCCTHDLTIGVDENAKRFIEAIDWTTVAPHAPQGPFVEELPAAASRLVAFRHRLARDASGRCKFLTPDSRCSIHALTGRAVFKPCHVFPYRFAATPDGVAVITNGMCPTARQGIGAPLADQEPDLRSRLAVADVLRTEKYYLRAGEAVAWDTFKTIEGQLLELLNGDAPIKRKIWVALRWLDARLADPHAGVAVAWYAEPAARIGLMGRLAFQRFPKLFDPCFKDLAGVAPGEGIWPEHEAELTRFFRAYLFSKATTYPYGLVAGLNYVALVLVILERQLALHARRGTSEAFWREFYAVVHAGTFNPLLQVVHQHTATGFSKQAGRPAFGLTLLRLIAEVPPGEPTQR